MKAPNVVNKKARKLVALLMALLVLAFSDVFAGGQSDFERMVGNVTEIATMLSAPKFLINRIDRTSRSNVAEEFKHGSSVRRLSGVYLSYLVEGASRVPVVLYYEDESDSIMFFTSIELPLSIKKLEDMIDNGREGKSKGVMEFDITSNEDNVIEAVYCAEGPDREEYKTLRVNRSKTGKFNVFSISSAYRITGSTELTEKDDIMYGAMLFRIPSSRMQMEPIPINNGPIELGMCRGTVATRIVWGKKTSIN